jgi:hypothetical protein
MLESRKHGSAGSGSKTWRAASHARKRGKIAKGLGLTDPAGARSLQGVKLAPLLLVLVLLVGCIDTGSHVMIGQARTPTDPSQVVVYNVAPAHYTTIAQVAADSGATWLLSDSSNADEAMRQLKVEAAKVGANGLIEVALPKRNDIHQAQVATAKAVWVQ